VQTLLRKVKHGFEIEKPSVQYLGLIVMSH
jgi:hypothetical protein